MEIYNKEFKRLLFNDVPTLEIGVIYLENKDLRIVYDTRNDVFSEFNIYKNTFIIKPTDKQIDTTRVYFNALLRQN